MKTSCIYLFLLGAALLTLPSPTILADDTAPSSGSTNAGANTAPADMQGKRMERFKAAMAQLDLSDAQKEQIKGIRATVTDRKERRQQIMAVLTPDQKTKLMQLIQAHKDGMQSGTTAAPSGN